MCHTKAALALPPPGPSETMTADGVTALRFGDAASSRRIVVVPDIYGATPFYRGLATWLADEAGGNSGGAEVFLLDPFVELGELPQPTRDAAFARRHRMRDRAYVDAIEQFARKSGATGVLGFCLGGLYVFELARRGLPAALVSLYGFPQGMPNQDPLPTPFDYLDGLSARQTAVFGDADYLQPAENLDRLRAVAAANPAFELKLYPRSGHGFLADLDSEDDSLRANAQDALALSARVLGAH